MCNHRSAARVPASAWTHLAARLTAAGVGARGNAAEFVRARAVDCQQRAELRVQHARLSVLSRSLDATSRTYGRAARSYGLLLAGGLQPGAARRPGVVA